MTTLLDHPQVLKNVYNEVSNRLRVEQDATVNMSGQLEVAISHIDDSIRIGNGTVLNSFTSSGGKNAVDVSQLNALVPEKYDSIVLVYTGSDLTTVTFKTGGIGGTTVATLTLAYTAGRLDSVAKT